MTFYFFDLDLSPDDPQALSFDGQALPASVRA
jgi:hypothetical protein